MAITAQIVADQLAAHLQDRLSLPDLVDWAERQMMEGEFETAAVRDAVARLGVADVRAFGLTWDDCQRLLNDIGFAARVHIASA